MICPKMNMYLNGNKTLFFQCQIKSIEIGVILRDIIFQCEMQQTINTDNYAFVRNASMQLVVFALNLFIVVS